MRHRRARALHWPAVRLDEHGEQADASLPQAWCTAHLKPARPEPEYTIEDVRAVTDFLHDFIAPGFTPLVQFFTPNTVHNPALQSHGRHEAVVNFALILHESTLLLSREWLEQTTSFYIAHTCFWKACLKSPSQLQEADAHGVRWQLAACHYNRSFCTDDQVADLFSTGYLVALLCRLRHLNGLPAAGEAESYAEPMNEERAHLELWESNTKYLGYMARDRGQFGSIPLADSYGHESDAYTHDNDYFDQWHVSIQDK